MKKLLLRVVTMIVFAPAAITQTAEIKRSVSEATQPISIVDTITQNDVATMKLWLKLPALQNTALARTVFAFAVENDKPAIIELFLNDGFNVNFKTRFYVGDEGFQENWTPLMAAANLGYTDMVQLLLNAGADTTATNDNGDTALNLASTDAIRNLIRKHSAARAPSSASGH